MSVEDIKLVDYTGKILSKDDVNKCVEELSKLVLEDGKLKNFRRDNSYLLRFLHCTNFNVTAAFKWLQGYFNHLQENPDWFASTSPLDKKEAIEAAGKAIIPGRDKSGRSIYVTQYGKMDFATTNIREQELVDEIWMESVLEDPITQATGICCIMDAKGYSWKYLQWLTPSNMRIAAKKADLFPCKANVFHIVNLTSLANIGFKILWPFISEKIKERIKRHNDWSSLHEYISPDILPPEYGGTGPEIDFAKLNTWLFNQNDEISERLKHQRIVKT